MKAVITVVGKDTVGILAEVTRVCAENNINVEDVTQSILQDIFAMIMVVDMTRCATDMSVLQPLFTLAGKNKGVEIRLTRMELFDAMHRI